MAGVRALPDLKSRLTVDTTSLKAAEVQAMAAGNSMSVGLGKGSNATKLLSRDLKGLERDTAKVIPGLGGMGNSMMGLPPMALAAAAAIGVLVIAGKSVIEISDKWEAAQKGLAQATDSISGSYEGAQREVNDFIATNRRYISSQSEVVDSYAALLRQGNGTKKAQEDLNLALDLSALKHISLADATTLLQQAEMGRGRALLPLGIQMKEYPVLMETATQAAKKLDAAEKGVSTAEAQLTKDHIAVNDAQMKLTQALHAHGAKSDQVRLANEHLSAAELQLKNDTQKLKDATDALAAAHDYAKAKAAASAEIHELLHQKLDGGRKSTSDLTQAQNQLSNTWQGFAHTAGPALNKVLAEAVNQLNAMLSSLNKVFDAIGWLIGKIKDLIHWLGQIKVPNISLPFGIGGPQGHAAGGPVVPGGIYTVGEQGPETLVMDRGGSGGMVIPHGGSGGGGGGGGNVYVTVHGSVVTERQLTLAIREGIRRLDKAQT